MGRTISRMKQWVWWKGLAQNVREYIDKCLICKRIHQRPPTSSVLQVLTKPSLFQLVSLDFVGPREVVGVQYYYLVAVDHASRFIVSSLVSDTSTAAVVRFLQERWIPYFREPTALLTDRGSAFTSQDFVKYVTEALGSHIVYISKFYPQGNAVNESSHHSIASTIRASLEMGSPMTQALDDAVGVHNTTPHSSTGVSPHFALFGTEPSLPGWQRYRASDPIQRERLQETRLRAIYADQLRRESPGLMKETKFCVGDWIVYWRGNHRHLEDVTTEQVVSNKFSSEWSLPARVVEVKDKVLMVHPWGRPNTRHQVPITKLRILQGEVPPSLQLLNLRLLEIEEPHLRDHLVSARKRRLPPVEFSELLDDSALRSSLQKKTRPVPESAEPAPVQSRALASQVEEES